MSPSPSSRRHFLKLGAAWAAGLALADRCFGQAVETPLPMRVAADRIDGPPVVSAAAWAIAEGRTGRVLWGSRESAARQMARDERVDRRSQVELAVVDNGDGSRLGHATPRTELQSGLP